MKTGQVLQELYARGGRKVILRTPRWEDLDDLMELVNSLMEEGTEISRDKKASRDEEIDWLSSVLARLEGEETFLLVAEVDGRVVASSDINRQRGYEKHAGVVGIVIKGGFRDLGIGTAMMRALVEVAKKMGLKVLTLSAYASTRRAIHVHEKVGFVQTDLIPKKHLKEGKCMSEVIMTKLLE
jgi:phosphinothricin acetyltransferase